MKKEILFLLIICLVTLFNATSKEITGRIPIPKQWKFITGDSLEYSKSTFDDDTWKTIVTGKHWENLGYKGYDGVAWYRIHLYIPSSLNKNTTFFPSLCLSLGKIDDNDETYFNGKKVGATTGWNIERKYAVPFSEINWDGDNVIAVKVHDTRSTGGMYEGTYSIGEWRLSDCIALEIKNHFSLLDTTETSLLNEKILFHLKIPVEKIDIRVKTRIYEPKSKRSVFLKKELLVIGNKADTIYTVKGKIKEHHTYLIEYSVSSKSFSDTLSINTLFSYKKTPRLNEHLAYPVVRQAIPNKVVPFAFENIQLGGYLGDRINANLVQRLLKIDEQGILECYYSRPGKQTWIGEYAGKYLHAASRAWRFSKNGPLKTQMDRVVDILIASQKEDGYLGTYLPENYWTEWDVWAHKYNMLGLLSYYSATGFKPALEASVKMGNLLCKTFGENKGQRNINDQSPHVGMASTSVLEPMTELYRTTRDKKYLDFCYYILKAYEFKNGAKIISTLNTVGKVDKVANAKAYEMLSNLTGIVKMYQLTGDSTLLKAAEIAWNDIATHKLYITGTTSSREVFLKDFDLPAGSEAEMGEGCVTTTWLQFSQALYYLTGEAKYMNEIEKSVYNHLLAAENPETGCVSYYTALQNKKPYKCSIHGHCCLASVPRGIAAIPELAYTKNTNDGIYINLFTPGELTDTLIAKNREKIPFTCTIASKFPEEGLATISVNTKEKTDFKLFIRVPDWCKDFKAVVDGKHFDGVPGQYLAIEQTWNIQSVVDISFDVNTHGLDGGISYQGFGAVKMGAQVLSVDQALNPEMMDLDKITIDSIHTTMLSKSLLPEGWIGTQLYSIPARYNGKPVDLKLVPYADAGQTGGDIRVWIRR